MIVIIIFVEIVMKIIKIKLIYEYDIILKLNEKRFFLLNLSKPVLNKNFEVLK